MATVADIQTAIWEEIADLSDDAALLYIWSFSNLRINPAGFYKVPRRSLCEGRLTPARLDTAIDELTEARYLFYTDGAIWVRTHVKHYRSKTVQTAKSIAATLRKLAGHPLVAAFVAEYHDLRGFAHLTEELARLEADGCIDPVAPSDPASQPAKAQAPSEVKRANGRRKPAPPAPDALPADLPDRLRPIAESVATALRRVADAKGGKPVTLAAVGRAVAAFPDHDHGRIAGEFEHYWVHGHGATKARQDIVLTYRNRLGDLPATPATRHLAAVPAGGRDTSSDADVKRRVAQTQAALAREEADLRGDPA